jgi:sialic acid synthase SpsE
MQPYLIAEIACAHDGSVSRCLDMCLHAIEAGFDAVQLQMFKTSNLLVSGHYQYELIENLELSLEENLFLLENLSSRDVEIIINPLEPSYLQLEYRNISGIKIHSGDLTNPYMLEKLEDFRHLPISLGVGASTNEEIYASIRDLEKIGVNEPTLVHGFQSFPTPLGDIQLARLEEIKKTFNLPVAYHDHCNGSEIFAFLVPAMSLAYGVRHVEKHITDYRSREGTDYISSIDFSQMKMFVQTMREAYAAIALGKPEHLSEGEKKYRRQFRKSRVYGSSLAKGHCIRSEDILFLRTNDDIDSINTVNSPLEGKRLIRDVKQGQVVSEEDFDS